MSQIQVACDAVGGQAALARSLGIAGAVVNQWVSGFRPIPIKYCHAIERQTNGAVTCEDLRPEEPWRRIPDASWPHPGGRPVLDFAAKEAA